MWDCSLQSDSGHAISSPYGLRVFWGELMVKKEKGDLRLFLAEQLRTPHFQPFIQEFSEHGLQITVCKSPDFLPAPTLGKSKTGLSKWGLKVLVHNCPRLPTIVDILWRKFPLERGPKGHKSAQL